MSMYPVDVKVEPNDRYMCDVAGGCSWTFDAEPDLKKNVTHVAVHDPESTCEVDSECSWSNTW